MWDDLGTYITQGTPTTDEARPVLKFRVLFLFLFAHILVASQCGGVRSGRPSGDPGELAQGLERSLRDWRSRGGRLFSRDAANQYEEPVLRAQLASACLLSRGTEGPVPPRVCTDDPDPGALDDGPILAAPRLSKPETPYNSGTCLGLSRPPGNSCGGSGEFRSMGDVDAGGLRYKGGPLGATPVAGWRERAREAGASSAAAAAVVEWTTGTLAVGSLMQLPCPASEVPYC